MLLDNVKVDKGHMFIHEKRFLLNHYLLIKTNRSLIIN